jgi:hypothetical protein
MIPWCDPVRNFSLKKPSGISPCSTWSRSPGQIREVMATTPTTPEIPAAPAPQKPYLISSPCPPSPSLDRDQGEAPRLVPPSLHQLATSTAPGLLAALVNLAKQPGAWQHLVRHRGLSRLRSPQAQLTRDTCSCLRSRAFGFDPKCRCGLALARLPA